LRLRIWSSFLLLAALATATVQAASQGGPLPGPLPLFPSNNWWNADISAAPVDPNSAAYLPFMGTASRKLHPDFGGEESTGSVEIYGIPYILVDGSQPKVAVQFDYSDESDGVNHNTDTSFPFYPIPPEAITQPHWIEGGFPGNSNVGGDRHMLIVDTTNKHLYELYAVFHNGTGWEAGSGAFFDLNSNAWPRPLGQEGWTSADAAGLAILPGLVRYDEVYTSAAEIGHAFRVTVSSTNGYVYPGSHVAGDTVGALPMGARLRLKAGKDISGFPAEMQKIFRAMKKHGLIVADNGSNMYITGTFDTRWDNGILNPAFEGLTAGDFEVIQLGWQPPQFPNALSVGDANLPEPAGSGTAVATFPVTMSQASADTVTVNYATLNGTASAGADYTAKTGVLTFAPTEVAKSIAITVNGDPTDEPSETFTVRLSSPVNASIADADGTGSIVDDDPPPQILGGQAVVTEGTVNATVPITLSAVSGFTVTASYATANGSAVAPADYTAKSGTVSIPPGSTGTSVSIAVRTDALDEPNEAFLVSLSSPANATLGGAGQVTILDNDGRAALCLPIITLPTTITAQGNYCLVQNLSTSQTTGAAVTIGTDFASLDLKGFKIGGGGAGLGTQAVGVYALNRKNITIKNGNIRGFLRGVYLQDDTGAQYTASQGHLVHGLLADQNTKAGIHVMGRGNVVRQNQVVATTGTTSQGANADIFGILSEGPGARILGNDVTDAFGVGSGFGYQIRAHHAFGGVVEKNRIGTSSAGASTIGLHILNTQNLLAVGNRFTGLGAGINYDGSTGPYRDNIAHGVAVPYSGGTNAGNNQ
jgi:hypothetical protein